jgi:hypothetical protein
MNLPQIFSFVEPAGLKLFLGPIPVEAVDLYPVLESVTVNVSRKEPGVATIVLSAMRDETGAWPVLDGGYFTRWNPVRIQADFGGYAEDVLWGHVLKVTPEFPADRGAAKATVEIQDESIALDRAAVNREWNSASSPTDMSDGMIVSSIATSNRLSIAMDGGQGLTVNPMTQDKTDFRFIAERAEKTGYEFRVQFGEVYFGPINLSGTPQDTLLVYAGPDTSVREFSIAEEGGMPAEAVMATVDTGGSGEAIEARMAPNLPILGRMAAFDEGQTGLQDFSWQIKGEGDAAPDAAEMLAQAKVNEASLSITAEALVDSTIYGHVVQPGRTINVDGIGERYGGRFYVDNVEHVFDAEGYTQKTSLLKNGVNEG